MKKHIYVLKKKYKFLLFILLISSLFLTSAYINHAYGNSITNQISDIITINTTEVPLVNPMSETLYAIEPDILVVNVKNSSGIIIASKGYNRPELEALAVKDNAGNNLRVKYSSLDRRPAWKTTVGTGVEIANLITDADDNIKSVNAIDTITFSIGNQGGSFTTTYNDLYDPERKYFKNLTDYWMVSQGHLLNDDPSYLDGNIVPPMIALNFYQARYLSDAAADSATLSPLGTPMLCFGLKASELISPFSYTNNHFLQNIDQVTVQLTEDDHGNTFDTASQICVTNAALEISGDINYSDDIDMFTFTSNKTATYLVSSDTITSGSIQATLYQENNTEICKIQNNTRLNFIHGQRYYLKVEPDSISTPFTEASYLIQIGESSSVINNFAFERESYIDIIPESGVKNITTAAIVTDSYGNMIPNSNISYNLASTYAGVTIDSSTGAITITSSTQPGSVQVIATYQNLTCSAMLIFTEGPDVSHDLFITKDFTYYTPIRARNISDFSGKSFMITYDSSSLEPIDLCAFTREKETSAGSINGTGITITSVSDGYIVMTVDKNIPDNEQRSGVINVIKFRAKTTGETSIEAGYN